MKKELSDIEECMSLIHEVLMYERLSYPSQHALELCIRKLEKLEKDSNLEKS